MPPRLTRLVVVGAIGVLVVAFFALDLGRFASLDALKTRQAAVEAYRVVHPWQTAGVFFAVYVLVAAASLPGAAIMTLAAGALFGVVTGTLLVSFASSLGATLAFLSSRFVLRDAVQRRFGDRLKAINAGVEREGAFYLFTLRLVPVFPFFLVNLLMGLTPIAAATFYGVSQVGMLPATVAYVNAGTQLAQLEGLTGILSPALLLSFTALGLLPLVGRRLIDAVRLRAVYRPFAHLRPASVDNNLVVIGAGSAGLVASYIAATVKARVTLVEKHRMGGDCLHTGCVPSKALLRSAKLLADIRRAPELGIRKASADFDFADVMARVQRVVGDIAPHDSVERYTRLGVTCVEGAAAITSPWTVEVTSSDGTRRTLTTTHIIIAAGARPVVPPLPGLAEVAPLTSDTVWGLRTLPRRLVVLGGGPIGCELAQAFARFGSQVTQVEMGPRLLAKEDAEFSALVARTFTSEGIDVRVGHRALGVEVVDGEKRLLVEHAGATSAIAFDEILCAVGRAPVTAGYGLEALGIPTTKSRTVEVNGFLETRFPNILACGDVAGPYQFTHTASHAAWFASVNALFGRFRKFRVDYSVVPWATFTEPEVARVGLNEQEAVEQGVPFTVTTYGIDDLDRAIADGAAVGLVKVLTAPGSDKILGATIAGAHAGDLLTEFVTAMKHGLGLNKILGTIHTYPTMAEASKFAAGAWKRGTVTRGQHTLLSAFHAWRRGAGGFGGVLGAVPALWRDQRLVEPPPGTTGEQP
ncbi:MAG: FAD-dependent oxidoreductase [Acidobacteria bacterium]|nr:FAD-dependent oxidoreductase [Acidobacteriota bacterium]